MTTDQKRHMIVLVQFDDTTESRSFMDYEGVLEALDGVCQLYAPSLEAAVPKRKSITHDISDFFGYMDGLGDVCCLAYNPQRTSFIPRNREWIKACVLENCVGV